jgi:hypothetical protein
MVNYQKILKRLVRNHLNRLFSRGGLEKRGHANEVPTEKLPLYRELLLYAGGQEQSDGSVSISQNAEFLLRKMYAPHLSDSDMHPRNAGELIALFPGGENRVSQIRNTERMLREVEEQGTEPANKELALAKQSFEEWQDSNPEVAKALILYFKERELKSDAKMGLASQVDYDNARAQTIEALETLGLQPDHIELVIRSSPSEQEWEKAAAALNISPEAAVAAFSFKEGRNLYYGIESAESGVNLANSAKRNLDSAPFKFI